MDNSICAPVASPIGKWLIHMHPFISQLGKIMQLGAESQQHACTPITSWLGKQLKHMHSLDSQSSKIEHTSETASPANKLLECLCTHLVWECLCDFLVGKWQETAIWALIAHSLGNFTPAITVSTSAHSHCFSKVTSYDIILHDVTLFLPSVLHHPCTCLNAAHALVAWLVVSGYLLDLVC